MTAKRSIENITCFKEKAIELSQKVQSLSKKYSRFLDWETESSISDFLDDYFQYCFSSSMTGPELDLTRNPYALLAMGDYVNEKNCFYPEIKILFLFKEYIPDKAANLIKEVLYPLWDIGFKVHSYTRTLNDCVKLASKDSRSFFSIFNSRLICGVSLVYSELHELLRNKIITYKKSYLLNGKHLHDMERHRLYEGYKHIIEPDPIKVKGGLSDYHSLFVMSKIKFGIQNKEDLKYKGILTHEQYDNLCESLEFIRDIIFKIKIQFKEEKLGIGTYKKLSKKIRVEHKSFSRTSEWFLKEITNRFCTIREIYESMILQINPKDIKKIKKNNSMKNTNIHGLQIKGGMLDFSSVNDIIKFPELIIHIFKESSKLDVFISPEAKKVIKDMSYLLDSSIKKRYLSFFNDVLLQSTKKDPMLDKMLESKVIENIIPDFKKIYNLFKIDGYHEIPIDKHLIETVYNINSFGKVETVKSYPLLFKVFNNIDNSGDRKLLLWSGFLHHFRKINQHEESSYLHTIKLLFSDEQAIGDLLFMIENSDLLDKSGDLNGPDLQELASKINSIERLNILFLLTAADIKSRGSMGLSKESFSELKDKYSKLKEYMEI